jgi:hypothetical protein
VTPQEISDALDQYRAGLETAVSLLKQLRLVATKQHEGTQQRNFAALAADSDTRDRLTGALVAIEPGMRAIREALAASQADFKGMADYEEVMALRQVAADLVASILETDKASMQALADAELARRAAMAGVETGETTLAAYRRVLSPPVGSASVLNLRG